MPDQHDPSSAHHHHRVILALVVIFVLSLGLAITLALLNPSSNGRIRLPNPFGFNIPNPDKPTVATFKSEEEFKAYLESGQSQQSYYGGIGGTTRTMEATDLAAPSAPNNMGAPAAAKADAPDRYSQTNVQVSGIDEPDILKTDGNNLYFSPQSYYYGRPIPVDMGIMEKRLMQTESAPAQVDPAPPVGAGNSGSAPSSATTIAPDRIGIMPPYEPPAQTSKIISAFPPSALKQIAKLDQQGDLLLSDKNLAVFSHDRITSYDVSNPSSPSQSWQYQYGTNSNLVTARLHNNQLYVITQSGINYGTPCPITPLISTGKQFNNETTSSLTIPCGEIYHPTHIVPVELTYTALIIDPKTGEIAKRISFVGSYNSSVVYMSPEAVYLTYSKQPNQFELISDFYSTAGSNSLPADIRAKLSKLRDYDISDASKLNEFQILVEKYYNSLTPDQRLKIENEYTNQFQTYIKSRIRDLESTQIVKIDVKDLTVSANGQVPGTLLNQFSLDEYNDHLRLATTINGQWGASESANDIYVLDNNLNQVGSILDLGLSERIYSARFIADKGYLVTFRQTDPFYVFDLSNPRNPKKSGELKIPGFSSYLHPLTDDLILGVGQESNKVKLSLFDVSNPTNPTETSKYLLDEYYSEISQTHHAFLHDSDKGIFFIPGSQGAYIFNYENNTLKLARAVSGFSPRRALFINDYLYIVSDSQITVLNENDWTEVNKLGI